MIAKRYIALAVVTTACHQNREAGGPMERAGKHIDHAADKTGDALERAAQKTAVGADKAAHATGKAFEKAGDKLQGKRNGDGKSDDSDGKR
jgi:hypothetical protein